MKNIWRIFIVCAFVITLAGCEATESNNNSDVISMNSEFFDNDVNGKLSYTITNAEVYHSLSEAGITKDDCTELDLNYFEDDSDHLNEGCCLLILDVTAENTDAESDYKNWDNSIFRADSINLVTKDGSTVSPISYLCYFSMHDKCTEHPFAYKLPKGDSCTFKVGHIVGEEELPITYASDCSAYSEDAVYISLGFEKAE